MVYKATGACISTSGLIVLLIIAISLPLNPLFFNIMIALAIILILGGPIYSIFSIKINKKRKLKLEQEEQLLEVYFVTEKGKQRVQGYVDQNSNFLSFSFKLRAYIENNKLFSWNKNLIFDLKQNQEIYDGEHNYLGAIKDFQIYNSEGNLYCKYNKTTGEVEDYDGETYLLLKGNLGAITHIVFLGIMFSYADLFC